MKQMSNFCHFLIAQLHVLWFDSINSFFRAPAQAVLHSRALYRASRGVARLEKELHGLLDLK